ncbi:hypothetical protein KBB96_14125 [Luteolibacter ambystomatis]|uniref:Transmembrane protein n=1 Tax=Luteolibacter ambystomatis TaxID=2824561 RepID=A0A975G725_9BACT|nr:hypothetical protein [Luteolibacter ambystomatis]QUE50002.1 hypothetical protein KBB96_14125 [Luteolibacter ambystomatis]
MESVSGGCLQVVARPLLFISSVWVGSMAGGMAIGAGAAISDPLSHWSVIPEALLMAPLFLLSSWFILNFILVVAGLWFFIRTERDLTTWWRNSAVLFSLMVVLGGRSMVDGWEEVAMWTCWMIGTAVIVAAVVFIERWQSNRRAGELAHIAAFNAQRRAEMESRGIATFDPESSDD